jgi:pimeloyl-ACP methyl ester carboxylesterase
MTQPLVRPFRIEVPDEALTDLRSRLSNTRWPAPLPGAPWERGVPLDYLKRLAQYWADGFDWREQERQLNAYPQFLTTIDGQTIHFLHVRSAEPDAIALLLVHGWPGSVVEFLDVIGPLTNPRGHGLGDGPAFHLVIPTLAGFGYSTPLSSAGWTPTRNAAAFVALMDILGHRRYGVQGGDYGAFIGPEVGRLASERVIGAHINAADAPFTPPRGISAEERASLTETERARVAKAAYWAAERTGYFKQQSSRPQTLAYGLTDSPVGQLAWIVEKFKEWTYSGHELPEDAVAKDRLLTNISLYWFTASAGSSANIYYEVTHAQQAPAVSQVPTAVATFAEDLSIRRYGERFHNIVAWHDFDTGGHFAAMETPDLLVRDIREFFATLG